MKDCNKYHFDYCAMHNSFLDFWICSIYKIVKKVIFLLIIIIIFFFFFFFFFFFSKIFQINIDIINISKNVKSV